jgi:phosphate-selective porin
MKKIRNYICLAFVLLSVKTQAQGCMESTSASGGAQIIGYIQGEFSSELLGKDAGNNSLNKNSFYFRRARLGVTGTIPYDFSYYVMAELSPTLKGPYLLDAFITYKRFAPYVKVSVGQFKSPFGLELSTPCQSLYTVDRSQVVNELASPFRDQGIMISGGTDSLQFFGMKNKNILSYSLALTNGTGLNAADNNRYKDIIGRVAFAPCSYFQVGGSLHYGKQKNPDATVTKPDVLTRWGADLQLKKSMGKFNFLSQSEYIYGKDEGSKMEGGGCGATPTIVPGTFERNGFYSQLMVLTPWKVEPVIKYASYDPDKNITDDDPTSYTKNAVTFGFNYYFNDWTRLQFNYQYNVEGSSSTDYSRYNEINNDIIYLQLQVKFN